MSDTNPKVPVDAPIQEGISMPVGYQVVLAVKNYTDLAGTVLRIPYSAKVEWTVDGDKCVSVKSLEDNAAVVLTMEEGTCTITGTVGKFSKTYTIVVENETEIQHVEFTELYAEQVDENPVPGWPGIPERPLPEIPDKPVPPQKPVWPGLPGIGPVPPVKPFPPQPEKPCVCPKDPVTTPVEPPKEDPISIPENPNFPKVPGKTLKYGYYYE